MSAFDFGKLVDLARKEIEEREERNNRNGGGYEYGVTYVGSPGGKLKAKLLPNMKSGLLQRKIFRHRIGGKIGSVPCLSMYGMDCPICKAIKDTEVVDKNSAYRKYGAKIRGICFAQVMDYSDHYVNKDYPIEKGSIRILMYPLTTYNQITQLISDAGERVEEMIGKNEGKAVMFSKTNEPGASSYSCTIDPWEMVKSFNSEEEFEKCLDELPDLSDVVVPRDCSEEMLQNAKAAAETIMAEYFNNASVNPNMTQKEVDEMIEKDNEPHHENAIDMVHPSESSSDNLSDKPDCFGKYEELGSTEKCSLCPLEVDCLSGN